MSIPLNTKIRLRRTVRYLYDTQKLRISTSNRDSTDAVELEAIDLIFLTESAEKLKGIESDTTKELKGLLKGIPIWDQYLKEQKGIGPRLGAVLLAEFDVHKAPNASSFWKYAGFGVTDGVADRMRRGDTSEDRITYNAFLKAKLAKVMGDSFIKANSPWRQFYDNYKTRKQNQLVDCMLCEGKGTIKASAEDAEEKKPNGKRSTKKPKKEKVCPNCNGLKKGPWGRSELHRHRAAVRYMCKMFLADFWKHWRELEGLEVRPPYAEEYLGRVHHGNG